MGTRRILVTGASGFIGRHALAPLTRLGFEVHAVTRAPGLEALQAAHPDVRWHAADLLAAPLRGLLESLRPTHLLHCAWYAEHGKFWTSPLNLDWLAATLALLRDFAETGGRRFVGAGSCAEYDWSSDVYDERTTPLRPATLYGAVKAAAFLTGGAWARQVGVEFAWGRVFHLFGPGESPGRFVPALCRAHLNGQPLDCTEGTQARDFLPVDAVADAFARLCAVDAQGAVNIGSGRAVTLRELSEMIAGWAGKRGDVRFGALPDSGPARLVPVIDRLLATGWTPPRGLEPALRETLEFWRGEKPAG